MSLSGVARIGVGGGAFGRSLPWHLDPQCKVQAVCS